MNPHFTDLIEHAGLSEVDLDRLKKAIALDYPSDPMMQDLRLVRTLHSLVDRRITLAELFEDLETAERPTHQN